MATLFFFYQNRLIKKYNYLKIIRNFKTPFVTYKRLNPLFIRPTVSSVNALKLHLNTRHT